MPPDVFLLYSENCKVQQGHIDANFPKRSILRAFLALLPEAPFPRAYGDDPSG